MKINTVKISTGLAISCLASQVFASGFQLLEQNVTNLGTAYSGTAALAEDASIGYFNPAGLSRMAESQVVLSGIVIQGDFKLEADAATSTYGSVNPLVGTNQMGGGTAKPGEVAFVPTFHLAKRIDERWVLGFNATVPFGLATKYEETDIARYMATLSDIMIADFSPSISYQLLPCLSIGVGADANYGRAHLSTNVGNNVDLDGYIRNHAYGWGYGYHAGILWTPLTTTRVGLSYRSHVNLHLQGNAENQNSLGYSISKVRSDATLPETATLSLYHELNDQFALTADVAWTNWSRFHTLRLRYDRPLTFLVNPTNNVPLLTPDTDTAEHFKDTRRFALGLTYDYDSTWLFRVGVAYDQSPVRDEFRTARLPDSDRYWLALGAAYNYNENLRIDFGYAHLFFKDASINEHAPYIAQTETPISRATLMGNYKASANLVGLQLIYDFV